MAVPEEQARRELGERFGEAVTDHPDVMAECQFEVSFGSSEWHHLLSRSCVGMYPSMD